MTPEESAILEGLLRGSIQFWQEMSQTNREAFLAFIRQSVAGEPHITPDAVIRGQVIEALSGGDPQTVALIESLLGR